MYLILQQTAPTRCHIFPVSSNLLFTLSAILSLSVFLPWLFYTCVGRSSASCAWPRTDRQTRCLSARNSSRKMAGKSARLPRTKSWSWNCTQSVCGQMDVCLSDEEMQREGEWENVLFEIFVPSHTIHVITLVNNLSSVVCNVCYALFLKYLPS